MKNITTTHFNNKTMDQTVNSLSAWKKETENALLKLETEEDCKTMHSIVRRVDLGQFPDIEAAFEHRLYILDKIVLRSKQIKEANDFKRSESDEIDTMKHILLNGGDSLLDDLKAGRVIEPPIVSRSDYDKWMILVSALIFPNEPKYSNIEAEILHHGAMAEIGAIIESYTTKFAKFKKT